MKKSGLFILFFTFAVIAIFYFTNDLSLTQATLASDISVSSAVVNVELSHQPTIKPSISLTPTPTLTPTANPVSSSGKMSMSEVSIHNNRNDCYLLIKNNVYDVSSYIYSHPGGQGKIINNCGKEVTGLFASIHSNFAWDLLAKYKVGYI